MLGAYISEGTVSQFQIFYISEIIQMASVDGSRSIHGSSAEPLTEACGPCNYEGSETEAAQFCDDCKEFLCQNCADIHKRYKKLRNHKLLPMTHVITVETAGDVSCIVLCDCVLGQGVTSYCEDHREVICNTCKSTKHRKCKTVLIDDKSGSYDTSSFYKLSQKAKALEEAFDKIRVERNTDLQNLATIRETCMREITAFRRDLIKHLDTLEENILKELELFESQERQEIERLISSCSAAQQMIRYDTILLEGAKNPSTANNKFAADVQVSVRLKKCEMLLQEISDETTTPAVTFERNEKLVDLQKSIDKLGTLTTAGYSQSQNSQSRLFPQINVQTSFEVDIKLSEDSSKPWISGCEFLQDGGIILCDRSNDKIKLLDNSFTLKDNLNLQDKPWDVSAISVNSSSCIITLPDVKQLQYIEMIPRLKTGRVMQLDMKCWGIQVVGEEIYITVHKNISAKTGEVRVLDLDGNLLRRTGLNQDGSCMFILPYYLRVSPSSKNIYVSDLSTPSKITCLKSDCSVVYQYSDQDLKSSKGIYVDAEDNILVCGEGWRNVQIITTSGRKHSTVLTAKDRLKGPYSIAYREKDDTLIVGCWNQNNLFIYKCG